MGVTLLVQTPTGPGLESGKLGPWFESAFHGRLISKYSNIFKAGSQVLYETKVADRVVLGELIWLWFLCGPPAVFCCSSNI